MRTLHVYGTVFNNVGTAKKSLESISRIDIPTRFYIVDNYSTDGTYEELSKIPGITLIREKCSRGTGRQIAMQLACRNAFEDDFIMTLDLDTIYSDDFGKMVSWASQNLEKMQVLPSFFAINGMTCDINWKNLNNGEDWERTAHLYSLGYKLINFPNVILATNQVVTFNREKRYSRGSRFYIRILKNSIDLIRGWGIDSIPKLIEYYGFIKIRLPRKKWALVITVIPFIFVYCKIFTDIFSYGKHINRLNQSMLILNCNLIWFSSTFWR